MNYADIKNYDISNGPGVRVSLFVSGCNHHCKGCFNQCAWDFNYGKPFTEDTIQEILNDLDKEYISGITVLGGEPLEYVNQKGILPLIRKIKQKYPNKTIWCYTGFDYEKDVIGNMINKWDETRELMSYIDVLVDGKFEEDKKDLRLKFRGSSNQRIIDIKESSKCHKLIKYDI